MKTVPLLVCAALCTCLTWSSTVEITKVVGRNVVVSCLLEDLTRQEPPPGCIQDGLKCNVYKTPLKYLSGYLRSGSHTTIKTYEHTASDKKRGLVYWKNDVQGRLFANISNLTLEDSGL
ncbi:unnamed protein product [Knipowitschia caucasica]|uniref:Uncharacterized protein n=1 Tax=Knipowitschia caucasica TaxID=637954 RepID=A0AAV2LXV7_KNICA